MIEESLRQLEEQAREELAALSDSKLIQDLKTKYLGRKGLFAGLSARIAELPSVDEKRSAGQEINRVKQSLEAIFSEKESSLGDGAAKKAARFDVTMPGSSRRPGSLHPLTRTIVDLTSIFRKLGFSVVDGPEAETEYYNFEALNIPLEHPARDSFDTFYLENGKVLRSQTSPVQIRVMEKTRPPLKIVAPGKVYRPDAVDATHSFMFHQFEGLVIDEGISFADLKGILSRFASEFFGAGTKVRLRPSFFPFTEPSAEVDIWSPTRGWLEVLGCGMVHPNVLRAVKIDPEKYTGFAFGMGIERLTMLRYGVEDIRWFYENDTRFLRQFPS